MQKRFLKRLILPISIIVAIFITVFSIVRLFNENLTFFYSPSQLLETQFDRSVNKSYRLGGLVESGSLIKVPGTLKIKFRVTDIKNYVDVEYEGILPDLFKEGKGVVVEGVFKKKVFIAKEVLAKHDENYMPPKLSAKY